MTEDMVPFTLDKFEQHLRYQLCVSNGDILAKGIEDVLRKFMSDIPGEAYDEIVLNLRVYYEAKRLAHKIAAETVQEMRDELAEQKQKEGKA